MGTGRANGTSYWEHLAQQFSQVVLKAMEGALRPVGHSIVLCTTDTHIQHNAHPRPQTETTEHTKSPYKLCNLKQRVAEETPQGLVFNSIDNKIIQFTAHK